MTFINWIKERKNYCIIFLFLLFVSGLIGVQFTQAPNYDLYFYHYYNGWAFLNNRIENDFLPSWYSSYFNPLLDSFNYFLISKLNNHPNIFLFISNLKFGIFLFLSYLIFDISFIDKNRKLGIISCIILTLISPILILTMRFDLVDIQLANFALLSIFLYLKYIFRPNTKIRDWGIFLSAFVLGLGVGCKYSLGVFIIPMFVCTAILYKKIPNIIKTTGLIVLGSLIGIILTDAWWIYILLKNFKNPVFPYFNHIFNTTYTNSENIMLDSFNYIKPDGFWDWIITPLKNTYSNSYIGIETKFFEPKMILTFVSTILVLVLTTFKKFREKLSTIIDVKIFAILIIYIILGYYINLAIFGNLRYVITLIPLASIILVTLGLTYKIQIKNRKIYPILLLFVILNIFFVRFCQSDILFQNKTNILSMDKAEIKDDSTVLLAGARTSFIVPKQYPKAKYVGFSFPEAILNNTENSYRQEPKYKNHYYSSQILEEKNKDSFKNAQDLYIVFLTSAYATENELYDKTLEYYSNGEIKTLENKNCQEINHTLFGQYQEISHTICKIK